MVLNVTMNSIQNISGTSNKSGIQINIRMMRYEQNIKKQNIHMLRILVFLRAVYSFIRAPFYSEKAFHSLPKIKSTGKRNSWLD